MEEILEEYGEAIESAIAVMLFLGIVVFMFFEGPLGEMVSKFQASICGALVHGLML